MPEFDPPLRSLLQILHFSFISFLLFSKIISILSKKFHIFELIFLLDDAHGLEEDAHALSILKLLIKYYTKKKLIKIKCNKQIKKSKGGEILLN